MIIKNGNVFCSDGQFHKKDLFIQNKRIVDCEEAASEDHIVIDATGRYVIPGLVDIHSHGAYGCDFCDASPEKLKTILKYEKSCGITSYCPTSMTFSFDILKKIFQTINEIEPSSEYARIVGINMEGPFISPAKKGAQNGDYIQNPDIEMFRKLNAITGHRIRLITLAPEMPNALDFIAKAKDEVHISIGHTAADYDEALAAFQAGADHVTHLCNAMPPFHHRSPGVIGAASDCNHVVAELIADGIHIHPSMIRSIFKLFGADRIALISDSMEATGMEDGEYELGGQKVIKNGHLATLADGTLAGSATNLFDCMKQAVSCGIPLEDAVRSATMTPAQSIGMYPEIGCFDAGAKADVLILSENLKIEEIVS